MDLSLIIITKNEEANIAACLESVKDLAEEIILVDGNSADETVKTAETFGAKIFMREFTSFTDQKGFALAQASKKWVLNLDADEQLTPGLREEIKTVLQNTDKTAFYLPIQNIFLGRKMKHSGLRGGYKLRLALREGASYKGGKVHETLTPAVENTAKLNNPFLHTPYRTIRQYFDKFNSYTSLGAQTLHEKGKRFNPLQLLRPPLEFIKIYFFRLAVLDGFQGFLWAAFSSFYPFVKYTKLWEINRK